MDFEFDPIKSNTNKDKHGIDFEEAQALWEDEKLLEIDVELGGEPRILAIGMIGHKHWVAVYTWRNTVIRIISVRRARKKELALYGN